VGPCTEIDGAPEEGPESSTAVRGGLGYAYGVGQSWLPGGFLVPSAQPKDWTFEFWRGAGQFSGGVVEVVAGVGLIYGRGAAVGGGIAGAAPTGGASLLLSAVGQQRAAEIGAQGQHEYLNGDGQTVRWHFRGVLEIQELCETKITHGRSPGFAEEAAEV
jgi:hypothetical protein